MGRIKCEVKGYEHTYFEVGQHWKTRDDRVVEITSVYEEPSLIYPVEVGTTTYLRNGRENKYRDTKNDLVELVIIPADECINELVEDCKKELFEECINEPVEKRITEPVEEQSEDNLWEPLGSSSLKLEEATKFTLPEHSVEDKMVDILIQLLRQRDRDLEKLSLVFNTFIKMEKMK